MEQHPIDRPPITSEDQIKAFERIHSPEYVEALAIDAGGDPLLLDAIKQEKLHALRATINPNDQEIVDDWTKARAVVNILADRSRQAD